MSGFAIRMSTPFEFESFWTGQAESLSTQTEGMGLLLKPFFERNC